MQTSPYNPTHVNMYGLGFALFARRYLGYRKKLLPVCNGFTPKRITTQKETSVYCFLFLFLLRCFNSEGLLLHTQVTCVTRRVSSFGNLRIADSLASPRSLSQPLHVLHRSLNPRHPPYTLLFLQGIVYTAVYIFLSGAARLMCRLLTFTYLSRAHACYYNLCSSNFFCSWCVADEKTLFNRT